MVKVSGVKYMKIKGIDVKNTNGASSANDRRASTVAAINVIRYILGMRISINALIIMLTIATKALAPGSLESFESVESDAPIAIPIMITATNIVHHVLYNMRIMIVRPKIDNITLSLTSFLGFNHTISMDVDTVAVPISNIPMVDSSISMLLGIICNAANVINGGEAIIASFL